MSNVYKMMKKIVKYGSISFTIASISAYSYLQYINSILGTINIDRDYALDFYINHLKMTQFEAKRKYYQVLFFISFSRIRSYGTYSRACKQLNTKIVEPAIKNYKNDGIPQQMKKIDSKKSNKESRGLFNKIVDIRKVNTENIELREQMQKMICCNILLNLPQQNRAQVDTIHKYICEAGHTFKDPEILKYIEKIPEIEEKFPKDYLHKILFI